MLGYQEDESLSSENNLMNIESPHLSVYLTLEPTLPPQEPLKSFPICFLGVGKKKEYEIQRVAWYVSLLPCLSSTKNNGSIPKLWANSEQFVNLGIGDTDEKAILLTNFLLSLDYTAYLLIGSGIPDGLSCYVLVKKIATGKLYALQHQ
ncbi:Coiled-coil and C2 domain-containing protein 2A [Armadillidium vulgare]|nr:Coiled-coil and C2 domain-containing protein 2A [Armadillidium vulgare]